MIPVQDTSLESADPKGAMADARRTSKARRARSRPIIGLDTFFGPPGNELPTVRAARNSKSIIESMGNVTPAKQLQKEPVDGDTGPCTSDLKDQIAEDTTDVGSTRKAPTEREEMSLEEATEIVTKLQNPKASGAVEVDADSQSSFKTQTSEESISEEDKSEAANPSSANGRSDPQGSTGTQAQRQSNRKRRRSLRGALSLSEQEEKERNKRNRNFLDAGMEEVLVDETVKESIYSSAKVESAATAEHICICLAMQPFATSDRARLDSLRKIYRRCHVVSVSQFAPSEEDLASLPENFGHFATNFKNQRSINKRIKPLIYCLRKHNRKASIEVFFDFFWLENNCFDNLYGMHWVESAYQFCISGASRYDALRNGVFVDIDQ